jgi:ubiquinone/menaquinone biosynthesis C-methylase UbiE
MKNKWMEELHAFFDSRSEEVDPKDISIESLCYVSGRDPRLWVEPKLYEDMIGSIAQQLDLTPQHTLLEVGCATGFLALGLSPRALHYTGVDLSRKAIQVAARLNLKNATFRQAYGEHLPFPEEHFERSICYDVVTNFPTFDYLKPIVQEMVRVTKKQGKSMIGSVPDEGRSEGFKEVVQRISAQLEKNYGPVQNPIAANRSTLNLRRWYLRSFKRIEPRIVCYYFKRGDFMELGKELGLKTEIFDIHKDNPYYGYRFNVVYTKKR